MDTRTAGNSSSDGSCMRSPLNGLSPAAKFSRSGPEGSSIRCACGVDVAGWVGVGGGRDSVLVGVNVELRMGLAVSRANPACLTTVGVPPQVEVKILRNSQAKINCLMLAYLAPAGA